MRSGAVETAPLHVLAYSPKPWAIRGTRILNTGLAQLWNHHALASRYERLDSSNMIVAVRAVDIRAVVIRSARLKPGEIDREILAHAAGLNKRRAGKVRTVAYLYAHFQDI